MPWIDIVALIVAGLAGGFLAGILGIGGGTIYIVALPPMLRWWGVQDIDMPGFVIANSLVAIVVASVSATLTHITEGRWYPTAVIKMALGAVPAASLTLVGLVHQPWYSVQWYHWGTLLLFTYMLIILWKVDKKDRLGTIPAQSWWKWLGVGFLSGAVSALSGLGGGIITVPLLNHWLKVDIKIATALSLALIVPVSLVLGGINAGAFPKCPIEIWSTGYIIWPVVAVLSLGVTVASPIGVQVAKRMSTLRITQLYVGFIVLVMMQKLMEIWK